MSKTPPPLLSMMEGDAAKHEPKLDRMSEGRSESPIESVLDVRQAVVFSDYLICDPDSGILIWKERPDVGGNWNVKYAGRRAGFQNSKGYRKIKIEGQEWPEHHIVWWFFHDELPPRELDHIDRDKANNSINNLRLSNRSDQMMNQDIRSTNTSGTKGVYWSEAAQAWRATYKSKIVKQSKDKQKCITARNAAEAADLYPFKGTLKDHQVRALFEANLKFGHAYWLDPGAGKTALCIAESSRLYQDQKIDGVIVIAPNGPHEQWVEEQFPEWCDLKWTGVHNKQTPTEIKTFMKWRQRKLAVASINYESLPTVKGRRFIDDFIKLYPRFMLIVDESHKIKNPKAQRTQETMLLALRSAYRRLLSGTPLLKGLEDLWTQYETAQRGITGPYDHYRPKMRGRGVVVDGFFAYRTDFCITKDMRSQEEKRLNRREKNAIVGYRNQNLLLERTRPFATRIMAEEFMKSEKPDFMTVRVPMNEDQKREYRRMQEHLVALIDERAITAQNALVQMGKLQQIAVGFLYGDDPDEYEVLELGSRKVDAACDIIEQLAEPVIVWSHFAHTQFELFRSIDAMGKRTYKRAEVEEWKKDPEGVLIGNQTSGLGSGMNLQHAAAAIYVTNSFSSEARWQSLKRIDRMGQTRQVRYWDLITPNTLDEKVMKALADKKELSRAGIDALRHLAL